MNSVMDSVRSTTASILGALGAMVMVSFALIPMLNLIHAGFLQVFALPGRFLFASFHAAAIFVPLYIFAAAVLLRRQIGAASLLALNLSILPFLTLAVALRLAFDARVAASPVTAGVVAVFGQSQGATFFFVLTGMLGGLVYLSGRLWKTFDSQVSRHSRGDAREAENESDDGSELPVLELPPPAAAFAWKDTPRGRAREQAREWGRMNSRDSEWEAEETMQEPGDIDTEHDSEQHQYESFRFDDHDDDLPPVRQPSPNGEDERNGSPQAFRQDGDGVGLQIAWPNGRRRVAFDDAEEPDLPDLDEEHAEDITGADNAGDRTLEAGKPEADIAGETATARNGGERDRELVVEFANGRFRSLDGDSEISIGFDYPHSAYDLIEDDLGDEVDPEDDPDGELYGDEYYEAEAESACGFDDDFDDDEVETEDAAEEDEDEYNSGEDGFEESEYGFAESRERREDSGIAAGAAASNRQAPSDSGNNRRTNGRRKRGSVRRYSVPVEGVLDEYPNERYWELDERTKSDGETLRYTLQEFGIEAEVTGIRKGPVITMFEILPAPGVKLAKIVNLSDNIALRLAAQTVRIVAPIPGKHAVGIEVPNRRRAIVSFADLVQESAFKDKEHSIPLAIGKDIPGDAQIIDLAKTPHLLIAGATGSGKSVCVNSIICSVLYRRAPQDVKMILIDPKIVELKFYNDIPHLLTPVITEPKRAFQALQWALYEMERRYSLLDSLQVRDISSYNRKVKSQKLATETLPHLVIVVDEFADLMATSGKELESTLARLAAMSRAVGIHLVLATQRPSTDVITGLIKANIPSRIAFMVASKVDSRIILDSQGAEKLLGRGDMLFTSAWDPAPVRMQGAFLSEDEVERVVTHVKSLGEPEYIDDEIFIDDDEDPDLQEDLEDPLLEKAISVVQQSRKASASYLQRRLKVGYNRAARMIEEMERHGIVGPANGSKPRDILRNEAVGAGEQHGA